MAGGPPLLIISLVLAVIGLAALVFAVVTSNELVAWVCIGASVLGVILLIVDALQERQRRAAGTAPAVDDAAEAGEPAADYPLEDPEDSDDDSAQPDSGDTADADNPSR